MHIQVPTEDKASRFEDSNQSQGCGHKSEGQTLKPRELHGEAHGTAGISSWPDTLPHFSLLPVDSKNNSIWSLKACDVGRPSPTGYLQTSPPLAPEDKQYGSGSLSDR